MVQFRFLLCLMFLTSACSYPVMPPLTPTVISVSSAIRSTVVQTPTRLASSTTATPKPTETTEATHTPTAIPPPTRTIPVATLVAKATIAAFGTICEAPARDDGAEISPDGKWIAIVCRQTSEGGKSSYLHVFSLSSVENWQIFYEDFAGDTEYNRNNRFTPFHWSHDGRFLYAESHATWDGWFGSSDIQALIRLTLQTGQVDQIVNLIEKRYYTAWFSFSPSDQYLLYIPQGTQPGLHLVELDTWVTKVIDLDDDRFEGAGFGIWSPDETEMLLLVERGQQDLGIYSLLWVSLADASQNTLIDNIESWQDLMPDYWYDENQVVLRNNNWSNSFGEAILLNVRTGEISEFAQP